MRRRGKYNARRTEYLGQSYDSAAEASYAAILELQRKAGKIANWRRGSSQILVDGPNRRSRITYKPDFIVEYPNGKYEAIDVKGVIPREFRLKAILWNERRPGWPLRVVDGNGNTIWTLG